MQKGSAALSFILRIVRPIAVAALVSIGASQAGAAPRDDIVLGMSLEPTGLDPTVAAPAAIGQVTWQNVFEGLVRIDRDGAVQPQLAERWTISPDGKTYTFTLREGVRFHDGSAFDSTSARFTLDRARGETSTNPQKQFFSVIDRIETPDARTLVLHLQKPAGNLIYWLGWPASVMLSPATAETARTEPVGTGPFRFASWARGDRVVLERSADYWDGTEPPVLSRATFRFLSDPQSQVAALRAGDVDAFPELSAPELFAELEGDQRFETVAGKTELKVVAGMNNRIQPFSDVRVRQALMMAVDRSALIEGAYSGYGSPIGSHYTPNDPGYVDLTATHPYDPQKARALLAEAGYPNGFSFSIKVPQMTYAVRSAELLQAFFAEIGVTLSIVPTEFPAKWVSEVLTGKDFEMTIVAHAEPLDIAIYARPDYYFGYRNPAFDQTIARADAEVDETARLSLVGDAQRMLAQDVPALYLFVMPKLGVWNREIGGLWHDEPIPSNDLTDVRWAR